MLQPPPPPALSLDVSDASISSNTFFYTSHCFTVSSQIHGFLRHSLDSQFLLNTLTISKVCNSYWIKTGGCLPMNSACRLGGMILDIYRV